MTISLMRQYNVALSFWYNSTWASRLDETLEFFSVRNVRFRACWLTELLEIK
jgi:hypothetical protein